MRLKILLMHQKNPLNIVGKSSFVSRRQTQDVVYNFLHRFHILCSILDTEKRKIHLHNPALLQCKAGDHAKFEKLAVASKIQWCLA